MKRIIQFHGIFCRILVIIKNEEYNIELISIIYDLLKIIIKYHLIILILICHIYDKYIRFAFILIIIIIIEVTI